MPQGVRSRKAGFPACAGWLDGLHPTVGAEIPLPNAPPLGNLLGESLDPHPDPGRYNVPSRNSRWSGNRTASS